MMTMMIGSTMMMKMMKMTSWLASSVVVAIQEGHKEAHKALLSVGHHQAHKVVVQAEAHQVPPHKEDPPRDQVVALQADRAEAHLQDLVEVHQVDQVEAHPVQDLLGDQTLEVHREAVHRRVQPQQERRLQSVSQ